MTKVTHKIWLAFEIKMFKDYIDHVEQFFVDENKEITTKFEELVKTPDDDPIREETGYHRSYYDYLEESLIDDSFLNKEFIQRYRHAVVIQLYSFLEKCLNSVLPHFIKLNKVDVNKLKGNILTKADSVLRSQIKLSELPNYNFLQQFTALRNTIVHREGRLHESEFAKDLRKVRELEKKYAIELEESIPKQHEIKITDKAFLYTVLNNIESFLKGMYEGLK